VRPDARQTEGEAWARRELEALRAERFSPAALQAFLGASFRRSEQTRLKRPLLVRQARRWSLAGGIAWIGLAGLGREPFRRRLGYGMAWWGAVAAMLEWHLGMVETEEGVPRQLGPADALTLSRAWLVPVVADDLDPVSVLAAGATDLLDGPIARATRPTRAGRDLEGLVDAAVAVAALRTGVRTGRLSQWVAGLELARQASGGAFALAEYFGRIRRPSETVIGAGRMAAPLRIAGLTLAGAGRKGAGEGLLAAGSLTSLMVAAARLSALETSGPPPDALT